MDIIEWLVGSASSLTDPGFMARCVTMIACVQLMCAVSSLIGRR